MIEEPVPSVGAMLGQRRRRWINIDPALDQRFSLFDGECDRMGLCSDPHVILRNIKPNFRIPMLV